MHRNNQTKKENKIKARNKNRMRVLPEDNGDMWKERSLWARMPVFTLADAWPRQSMEDGGGQGLETQIGYHIKWKLWNRKG